VIYQLAAILTLGVIALCHWPGCISPVLLDRPVSALRGDETDIAHQLRRVRCRSGSGMHSRSGGLIRRREEALP